MKEHVDAVHAFIEQNASAFLLVFRVIVGLLFFVHGAQKFGLIGDMTIQGFASFAGIPLWLAVIGGLIELVGGLFIAAGFYTRYSAFAGALMMIAAYVMAHAPKGLSPVANGGELALIYFAVFIGLIAIGAGTFSVDAIIKEK